MKFNYGLEKKKFDENWEKMEKEYRAAGMAEEAISAMREYDWELFKQERIFCQHNQPLDCGCSRNDSDFLTYESAEDTSPFLRRYADRFSVPEVTVDTARKDSWIDELDSTILLKAIRMLTESEQELLRLHIIEEYTTREIAAMKSVSHQAVSKSIQRIKEKIKKVSE